MTTDLEKLELLTELERRIENRLALVNERHAAIIAAIQSLEANLRDNIEELAREVDELDGRLSYIESVIGSSPNPARSLRQNILKTHYSSLSILEEQQAMHGAFPPIGLVNQINHIRGRIAELETELSSNDESQKDRSD